MIEWHELLTRRYPKPGQLQADMLLRTFPHSPGELVRLFQLARGGRFRLPWLSREIPVSRFFAIGVIIEAHDVFAEHRLIVSRCSEATQSNLGDFGTVGEFVPIAKGELGTFLYCLRDGSIVHASLFDEIDVEMHSESLEAFLSSIRPKPLEAFERSGNDLVNDFLMSRDDVLLAANLSLLRSVSEGHARESILHMAVGFDCVEVCRHLTRSGFDPLESNAFGNNCVHIAASCDSVECLMYLMEEYKGQVDQKNAQGQTALEIACKRQIPNARAAIVLLHAGAARQANGTAWSFEAWLGERKAVAMDSYTKAVVEYVRNGHADDF